jgi:hypothetical protein
MSTISKSYTFTNGATILAEEHNQNFDVLYNWANGNITNANIKTGAAIAMSKLDLTGDATFSGDLEFSGEVTLSGDVVLGTANQGDILYDDGTKLTRLTPGTDGQVLTTKGDDADPEWATIDTSHNVAIFNDTKPANTDGGTFTSGEWRTRDLTTEVYNTITDAALNGLEIDSYSDVNVSRLFISTNSSYFNGYGQALTLATAKVIGGVSFRLRRANSPGGTLTAHLYAATGTVGTSAIPTGSPLASSSAMDSSAVSTSTSYLWHDFSFSTPYSASSGDYCIVLESTSGDLSNYVFIRTDSAGTHAGNSVGSPGHADGDKVWEVLADEDSAFKLYEGGCPNSFTLPAGTYMVEASCPGNDCGLHKAKLYNVTDSEDTLIGTSETMPTAACTTRSFITGTFTIASEKVFELQHRCGTTRNTDGFGLKSNFSVSEIYSQIKITEL